ncbi:MAG: hypothetical protein JRG73_00830 [Deltaproteobacteria bacterium]|nr:hypothetical protein [Deltaproteobacteria bacterium]MBW2305449.1 hypothetical protein [Deltaproteobacteria bacterium]
MTSHSILGYIEVSFTSPVARCVRNYGITPSHTDSGYRPALPLAPYQGDVPAYGFILDAETPAVIPGQIMAPVHARYKNRRYFLRLV